MRKIFILLLSFVVLKFAYSFDFYGIGKSVVIYDSNLDIYTEKNNFSKESLLLSTDSLKHHSELFLQIKNQENNTYVGASGIELAENYYFNKAFENKHYVLEACVKALYENKPEVVFEYTGDIKQFVTDNNRLLDFPESPWTNYVGAIVLEKKGIEFGTNLVKKIDSSTETTQFVSLVFDVLKVDESQMLIYVYYINNPYKLPNIKYNKLQKKILYTFSYTLDGDYLCLYLDNKPFISFVNFEKKEDLANFISTYRCFITEENYSIDKIYWPRHADGSCDYDGSKSPAKTTAATSSATTTSITNVSVKKIMTTNCNLKLRAAEATSSSVLTVMAQGTKVKILELGKAETIDGIKSNWVKVEVQGGAKDRDGKAIAPKTIGWCYGGYLE